MTIHWWCPHGDDRDQIPYCPDAVQVPDGVWALWGPLAVRHDCAPSENSDGSPRSPWAWHHRDFHENSKTECLHAD